MKYLSTRGGEKDLTFKNILFSGLASDGGLYVPDVWPQIDYNALKKINDYSELALEIIYPFIGEDIKKTELKDLIDNAYSKFSKNNIISFKNLKQKEYIVELFNGPTLAFKDFAMQLIIPIFDHYLLQENKKLNLIVATSGDTGSAAINAVHQSEKINVFCLFPKGRISSFQKKQMTTVHGENIFPIEVDGTFDDCQNIVKSILVDREFSEEFSIAAVNSINWSRVMFQIVYYFYTLINNNISEDEIINFSVPTGNFGDVYAGYLAKKMGLPINRLVVATNQNDILHRAILKGKYEVEKVFETISPSMDVQIASNFERLIYDLNNSNSSETKEIMNNIKKNGKYIITEEKIKKINKDFLSASLNEKEVLDVIKLVYDKHKIILDPHTAVGYGALSKVKLEGISIVLATAHPSKFPEAINSTIKIKPELPSELKHVLDEKENYDILSDNLDEIKKYIKSKLQ